MLHGFGDTGDMWAPVAAVLAKGHSVVVPDLRGLGLSSHPESGYDKKTQAHDIAAVMDKLKIEKAAFVTHDIGNMVGYAFAAQFPVRVMRWVVIDAPPPEQRYTIAPRRSQLAERFKSNRHIARLRNVHPRRWSATQGMDRGKHLEPAKQYAWALNSSIWYRSSRLSRYRTLMPGF